MSKDHVDPTRKRRLVWLFVVGNVGLVVARRKPKMENVTAALTRVCSTYETN